MNVLRLAIFISLLAAGIGPPDHSPADRNCRILSHRARIELVPSSNFISCTDTLTLRVTDPSKRMLVIGLLRLYDLQELLVNGKKSASTRGTDEILVEDLPKDSTLELTLSYSGTFPEATEYSSFSSVMAILREEECLPFGEKEYISSRITIVAPREWHSVTVGTCGALDTTGDVTASVWDMSRPVPLIGWICSGVFSKSERKGQVAPLNTYLFPADSAASGAILRLADSVLSFYNREFSPYRFSEFNIVEVGDGIAGPAFLAIAQPSFIMVKKIAFTTDDPFNRVEAVLPHELAHQWWPITVYVEDEDNAFLSEGMCEYSSMMYRKSAGTPGSRDSLGTHPLLGPLISRVIKGEDLPLQMKADLRSLPTHYLKSAFVHNMLRREIGDTVFHTLYREYARRFALRTASLDDFQALAEELSGKKLGPFFDQWVKKKGIPSMKIYNVKSVHGGAGWTTRGRVRMIGYDKFTALVDVGVETPAGMTRQRITVGADSSGAYRNDVAFEISTRDKPFRAVLDPGGDILKIQKLPVKLGDLRDPSDGVMIVGTLQNREYLLGLAREDSAYLERRGWEIRIKFDSSVTLGDLQRDKVFLYGKVSENSALPQFIAKFPRKMRNDSIETNDGTLYDSTLTLTQAVENPFHSHGIATWIAPLSPKAQPHLHPSDASWVITRGKDEISSGIWQEIDVTMTVPIP